MSVGNLKTQGQKGTNWTWQYKMLLGLDKIAASVATNGKEYEAELVSITCLAPTPPATTPPAGTVIRLEVRVWDPTSGAFTNISYYEPGSTTADPYDYTACTKTYLESGDATETTLQAILTKNTEIETTANAILAMNTDIEANTAGILADTAAIETNTDALINVTTTPTIVRTSASAAVTITDAVKSVSFYNASATDDAHINAVDLKPGETINFDAGGNGNKFTGSAFTYDADPDAGGAGDLLIIYVV